MTFYKLRLWWKRKWCKHSTMIKMFGKNRVYKECLLCGFETPGFILDGKQ